MAGPEQPAYPRIAEALTGTLVLDHIQGPVVVLDDRQRIDYLNPAAENLYAVSSRQALGQPLRVLWLNCPELERAIAVAIAERQPLIQRGQEVLLHTGQLQRLHVCMTPIDDGRVTHGLVLETTPLDAERGFGGEDERVNHQRVNALMLRGLAREIKNPLGGLRGAAQLLERQLPDSRLHEFTQVIIGEADRLTRLVNRMLGPEGRPEKRAVNVHRMLERVRKLVTAELPDDVEILCDYDPSLPELHADAEQLIQAFLNVVKNAIHAASAAPMRGRVILRTRVRRRVTIGDVLYRLAVLVEIVDNGAGIPRELREQIFFPLVTSRADGSGLGLSIAQNLITQHSGVIHHRRENAMTVFSIVLPIERSLQ